MTVYVDGPITKHGRMSSCLLLADTDDELHAFAQRLRLDREQHNAPPLRDSHYDLGRAKRPAAIDAGAVAIDWRQAGCMQMRRRSTGELGEPETAEQWVRNQVRSPRGATS